MERHWTPSEEQSLFQWMEKGHRKNWSSHYIFHFIAVRLGRSAEECRQKYEELSSREDWRIHLLERRLESLKQELDQLNEENKKLEQHVSILDYLLQEHSRLLLKMFGQEQPKLYVHNQ